MTNKKIVNQDIKRYSLLVFLGIIISFWLMISYNFQFRAGAIYVMLGFASLGGYILYREYFR